jgi:type I restriction enzyme S subunit
MSSEWPRFTVAELRSAGILLVQDGNHGEYRPRPDEFSANGICFIRAADMGNGAILFDRASRIDQVARARIRIGVGQPGDVLLSHKGTVGKVALAPDNCPEFVCSPQTTLWRVTDRSVLDRSYLYAYLQSPEFKAQLDSRKSETDMAPYVSLTAQRQLVIPLPPFETQRTIGLFFSILSERIALLRNTNATLEAISQALFKSWFVDFDPVRAKQEGRVPDGMDEATASLFPDSFEESQLGSVPTQWRVSKVENMLELAYGKALKASDRIAGEVPVYGSGGVTGRHNQALVLTPSIIIGRKGTVGSLYWENRPFFPIDTVFYVNPNKPLTFCFHQLQRLGLEGMNTDGAVPGLNRNNVYRLAIVIPPDEILMAFDAIVSTLRARIFSNVEQANSLSMLSDTVLPRLISGQLPLRDAAEMTVQLKTGT